MKNFQVSTQHRKEFVDITGKVLDSVSGPDIKSGICVVFVPHTTCGLTVNENADPSVRTDIMARLESLVPESSHYRHAEGNSDAHISSSLTGHSLTFIIDNGTLVLGTWQGIFLCEFDGPRTRTVWVKTIKG